MSSYQPVNGERRYYGRSRRPPSAATAMTVLMLRACLAFCCAAFVVAVWTIRMAARELPPLARRLRFAWVAWRTR